MTAHTNYPYISLDMLLYRLLQIFSASVSKIASALDALGEHPPY